MLLASPAPTLVLELDKTTKDLSAASGKDGSDLEASALDRPAGDASTLAPSRISPNLEGQVKAIAAEPKVKA